MRRKIIPLTLLLTAMVITLSGCSIAKDMGKLGDGLKEVGGGMKDLSGSFNRFMDFLPTMMIMFIVLILIICISSIAKAKLSQPREPSGVLENMQGKFDRLEQLIMERNFEQKARMSHFGKAGR